MIVVGPGCSPGFAAGWFGKAQVAVLLDREGFLFFSLLRSQRTRLKLCYTEVLVPKEGKFC